MFRVIWVFVLLIAISAFAGFGFPESGSSARTLAGAAAAASTSRDGQDTSRDVAVQSGVAAIAATIRGLTAVITAVSRSWWWPIEASLELVQDTVHRGWSAIRRLPAQDQARR